jgi:hypothetical protein
MPISQKDVIKALKTLCKKYDTGKANGTTFHLLKTNSSLDSLVVLILSEKNEPQTINSSHVLKHQRVENIKQFLKDTENLKKEFETLLPVIGDIADYIDGRQIKKTRKKSTKGS